MNKRTASRTATDAGFAKNPTHRVAGMASGIARLRNGQIHNLLRKDGLLDPNICAIVPDEHATFGFIPSAGYSCSTNKTWTTSSVA